jgi:hypothetical protein
LAVQPKEAFYLVIAPMSRTKPFASALADWLILISRTVDNESK